MNTTTQDTNADTVNRTHTASQPLERPLEGRMLGGVAAGIADFLGVDPTIVRIVFAVLTVIGGGAGVVLYLAGWLLIPEEGRDQSMASDLFQSLSAPAIRFCARASCSQDQRVFRHRLATGVANHGLHGRQ